MYTTYLHNHLRHNYSANSPCPRTTDWNCQRSLHVIRSSAFIAPSASRSFASKHSYAGLSYFVLFNFPTNFQRLILNATLKIEKLISNFFFAVIDGYTHFRWQDISKYKLLVCFSKYIRISLSVSSLYQWKVCKFMLWIEPNRWL